jgi:hypothetical protein
MTKRPAQLAPPAVVRVRSYLAQLFAQRAARGSDAAAVARKTDA